MGIFTTFQPLLFGLALIATGMLIITSIFKKDVKSLGWKLLVCGFGVIIILQPMLLIKLTGLVLRLLFELTNGGNLVNSGDTVPNVDNIIPNIEVSGAVQETAPPTPQTPTPFITMPR